jgi:hypothetical protein
MAPLSVSRVAGIPQVLKAARTVSTNVGPCGDRAGGAGDGHSAVVVEDVEDF